MSRLRAIFRAIPGTARIRSLLSSWEHRYCRGVYRTFADAQAAIPRNRLVGYDNAASARLYNDLDRIKPSDYDLFRWLKPLLSECDALFDFGGYVGRSYYPFQRELVYPDALRWVICDVPAVVKAGETLAVERGARHLSFTTDFRRADGINVFYSAGTLQYIDRDLGELLSSLTHKPEHVLINRVPLTDGPSFFTVQDTGPACHAYRITNRDEFIDSVRKLGYTLVDSWACHESTCRILFHPSRVIRSYTGMYMRRCVDSATDLTKS